MVAVDKAPVRWQVFCVCLHLERRASTEEATPARTHSQRFPWALKVVMASGMYMPFTEGQLCRLIIPSSSAPSLSEASNAKSLPHSYRERLWHQPQEEQ